MYPPLFKTNFVSSDGIDLGEKFISKDYLLSSYSNLLDNLSVSSLFLWGTLAGAPLSGSTSIPTQSSSLFDKPKQISSSKWDDLNGIREYHVAVIKSDGSLWVAGANTYGQLGLNDTTRRSSFNRVGTDNNWKQVYCGAGNTIAIKTDGSLWASGYNNDYQLGLGDRTSRRIFTRVGSANDWKYACIGSRHAIAIKEDGSLYAWGTNTYGLLGINNNSISYTTTFLEISGKGFWKQVASGNYFGVAIRSDGTLWSWGNSRNGQLGRGIINEENNFIGQVRGYWSQVCSSAFATMGVQTFNYT